MGTEDCVGCGAREITDADIERMLDKMKRSPFLQLVDDPKYEHRLRECAACPSYKGNECAICGCVMRIMARLENTRCLYPGGSRWETGGT